MDFVACAAQSRRSPFASRRLLARPGAADHQPVLRRLAAARQHGPREFSTVVFEPRSRASSAASRSPACHRAARVAERSRRWRKPHATEAAAARRRVYECGKTPTRPRTSTAIHRVDRRRERGSARLTRRSRRSARPRVVQVSAHEGAAGVEARVTTPSGARCRRLTAVAAVERPKILGIHVDPTQMRRSRSVVERTSPISRRRRSCPQGQTLENDADRHHATGRQLEGDADITGSGGSSPPFETPKQPARNEDVESTPRALRVGRLHAGSSRANFARSVFWPTLVNRTTSFVSSSSASTLRTRADAELRVPDAHARAQRHAGRLILVLVRVGRRRLRASPTRRPRPYGLVRNS